MVTYISVSSTANVTAAHARIDDFVKIVVNKFVQDRSNLVDAEYTSVIF